MPNLGFSTNVTPTTGVAVGKLYPLGTKVAGVADRPIVANTPGALDLTPGRRVTYAKPTGAGTNYAQFADAYLYPATLDGQIVTGATGIKVGIINVAAATGDSTVEVLLFPGCGL
jgi:hypothetical protein